jgi:hypothetical protein
MVAGCRQGPGSFYVTTSRTNIHTTTMLLVYKVQIKLNSKDCFIRDHKATNDPARKIFEQNCDLNTYANSRDVSLHTRKAINLYFKH